MTFGSGVDYHKNLFFFFGRRNLIEIHRDMLYITQYID